MDVYKSVIKLSYVTYLVGQKYELSSGLNVESPCLINFLSCTSNLLQGISEIYKYSNCFLCNYYFISNLIK